MVFSSYAFLFVFLPAFLLVWLVVAGTRAAVPVLLGASWAFYAWWRADFLLLLIAVTLLGWVGGLALERLAPGSRSRARVLALWIAAALAVLGWFKYAGFVTENLNVLLVVLSLQPLPAPSPVLPLGISFFTFHVVSYLVDVARHKVAAERSFLRFAAYMALFPHLIAGPIVRYAEIARSLDRPRASARGFARGTLLFVIGFAKKVLIANNLAPVADAGFALADPSFLEAWLAVLAYSFQLYFDFSGYSDMAIGLGRMIGARFPINFRAPYRSASITEFWRRWHVTLSRFLRDYVYVGLGGNRRGEGRTRFNLVATMLLGGLWHGAAWTFVLWGLWHGLLLALERALGRRPVYASWPGPARILATFALVAVGWVLFRSSSLGEAATMLLAMVTPGPGAMSFRLLPQPSAWLALTAAILVTLWAPLPSFWMRHGGAVTYAAALALFWLAVLELFGQEFNPFLYFQF